MRRPGRLRRVFMWGGLLACLLVGTAWLASVRWQIWYAWQSEVLMPWDTRLVGIAEGGVFYQAFHRSSIEDYDIGAWGWHAVSAFGDFGFHRPYIATREFRTKAWIPLWPAFAIASISTLTAWLWPRRRPLGECHTCGYNLTGNISGTCPECGTSIEPFPPK